MLALYISGFEATAPADIYKRWCQFGLLSSHSRLHGSSSYRVPWLFDQEACDVLRKFVNLTKVSENSPTSISGEMNRFFLLLCYSM